MIKDNKSIKYDETAKNRPQFILSSEVSQIIGKEEQDFKLSMTSLNRNPETTSNYQSFGAYVNSSNNNNGIINNHLTLQNQTINNMSLIGQIHSAYQSNEFVHPQFYELDNYQNNKNNNCISPKSEVSYNSSQQILQNNAHTNNKIELQMPSNYSINQNSSQQLENNSQTQLNFKSRIQRTYNQDNLQDVYNQANNNNYNNKNNNNLYNDDDDNLQERSNSYSDKNSQKQQEIQQSIGDEINVEDNQKTQKETESQNEKQVTAKKGVFSLMKMTNVKQFVNKLMKRVRSIMFKRLTRQQFGIVDDFASDFNYFIYENQLIHSEKRTRFKQLLYLIESKQ